jgi:Domain of unknown function (DUF4232)
VPAHLFHPLVDDADRIPLTSPETLRRVGNRRRRRAATAISCAVLAMTGGAVTALWWWLPFLTHQPPVIPASSPATTTTTTTPTPTTPLSCSATDLQYRDFNEGLGAGSRYVTYRFFGAATCHLEGAPSLTYFDGSGRAPIAAGHAGDPTELTVHPGDAVSFTIQLVDGYGGYSTDAPECASTVDYQQLAVVLPDGSSIPLTGASDLTVQCVLDDGTPMAVSGWTQLS